MACSRKVTNEGVETKYLELGRQLGMMANEGKGIWKQDPEAKI